MHSCLLQALNWLYTDWTLLDKKAEDEKDMKWPVLQMRMRLTVLASSGLYDRQPVQLACMMGVRKGVFKDDTNGGAALKAIRAAFFVPATKMDDFGMEDCLEVVSVGLAGCEQSGAATGRGAGEQGQRQSGAHP